MTELGELLDLVEELDDALIPTENNEKWEIDAEEGSNLIMQLRKGIIELMK